MSKPDVTGLNLETLIALGEEIQQRIVVLREKAAAELREHIEVTASKLGMTVQQVVKGSVKPRRRQRHDDSTDASDQS